MMKGYEELLKRAKSHLPQEKGSGERFEIPKVRSVWVGQRTIVRNFKEVADVLNRDTRHLMKFLTNEMATAGTLDENRATFQGKFPYDTFERLTRIYVENFVICPVCRRPDTRVMREKRFSFLVCEACGAKSSIKSI